MFNSKNNQPQDEWKPIPDPTVLTTEQLRRELSFLEDKLTARISGDKSTILARLDANDKATDLFDANLHRIPTETQQAVSILKELQNEKILRIEEKITEKETFIHERFKELGTLTDEKFQKTRDALAEWKQSNSLSINAVDTKLGALITAQNELTQARFEASQEAIRKADISTEKRFESVNEFRAQLSDQTKLFATKEALDSWMRESRTTHEFLGIEIQKSIDTASKAMAESNDRNHQTHEEFTHRLNNFSKDLTDRISDVEDTNLAYINSQLAGIRDVLERRISVLEQNQYQTGSTGVLTDKIEQRLTTLEHGRYQAGTDKEIRAVMEERITELEAMRHQTAGGRNVSQQISQWAIVMFVGGTSVLINIISLIVLHFLH
jgi:hypothetical protein